MKKDYNVIIGLRLNCSSVDEARTIAKDVLSISKLHRQTVDSVILEGPDIIDELDQRNIGNATPKRK
jgi:hypothetical protein